jgi:hypothetical protein
MRAEEFDLPSLVGSPGAANLEDFLRAHPTFLDELQAVLLFRRPFLSTFLVTVINIHFFILFYLNLPFYCFLTVIFIEFFVIRRFLPLVARFFFDEIISKGSPDEPNRIRDVDELMPLVARFERLFQFITGIVKQLAREDTLNGSVIYAGFLVCLFVLTYRLDFLKLTSVIVNFAMILPAFCLHPEVVRIQEFLFSQGEEQQP